MEIVCTENLEGKIVHSIRTGDFLPQIIKPFEEKQKTLVLTTSDSLWNNHFLDPKMRNHKEFSEVVLINNTFGIFETLQGNNLRIPAIVTLEWFYKAKLVKNATAIFQKKFIERFTKKKNGRRSGSSRAIRWNIADIGESEVALNIRGNIDILGQVVFQDQELVNTNYKENQSWDLEIDQKQNFNIEGTIGDRISVLVDQNSEADFSWENDILLNYEGKEDEVLKSIDAGNISLSLPSTKFVTYGSGKSEGLFGIKAVNQLGPLSTTSILSLEQVKKSAKTKTGDESASDISINDYNFVKDRYFFIDTTYRNNFYPLSSDGRHFFNVDNIDGISQITDVVTDYKLYKTVSTSQYTAGSIQGSAYINPSDISSYSVSGSWIELQREVDYEINQILGYIRLKSPVGNEAIGIAYDINNMDPESFEIIEAGYYDSTYTDYNYIPSGDNWESDIGEDGFPSENEDGCGGGLSEGYIYTQILDSLELDSLNFTDTTWVSTEGIEVAICGSLFWGDSTQNSIFDPNGDDYNEELNPDGTEGNGEYDLGEPFIDNDDDGMYDPPVEINLKLLKVKGNSDPSKPTWPLMFKNVYDLGARNINMEDFEIEIIHEKGPTGTETHSPGGTSFLNIFGLDKQDQYGQTLPGGDGKIDDLGSIVNPIYGEIILPFHMPFAYTDTFYQTNHFDSLIYWGNTNPELADIIDEPLNDWDGDFADEGDEGPAMYYSTSGNNQDATDEHEFIFKVRHSQRSSTMSLGFMVVEGSEEVILNGRTLTRNIDYTIDYFSGTINFITDEALDPTANISVTYEENELVSFDKKLMAGTRMELDLGDNNFIGMTALYYNQTIIDDKVDIGYEPLKNFIWDINGKYSRQVDFMTKAVDILPFIETTKPSKITIEGEYAQVIPNPNPLGQAFLDDFESSKITTSPSIMQRQWKMASPPLLDTLGNLYDVESRGKMYWYNPYNDVDTKEIWPDKETSSRAGNNKTKVLTLASEFTDIYQENPWNGITTTLYEGDYNQNDKKFLEIWLNAEQLPDTSATLHIDIGYISEDQNNNELLDMEDEPIIPGTNVGNGILDEGEDTGVDGCLDEYEDGDGRCLNTPDPDYVTGSDPNNDNWSYSEGSSDYSSINGTEGNSEMAGFTYPDTEDLNRDNNPDFYNSYFTYALKPNVDVGDPSLNDGVETGWKLFTILLSEFDRISENSENEVEWSDVRYIRLWMDGIQPDASIVSKIQIAKLELVGNKWQELGQAKLDSLYLLDDPWSEDESFGATVANTEEHNSWYDAPSDAVIEEDKLYGITSKEQSLVLNFEKNGIESNSIAAIRRSFETLPNDKKNSFFVYDNLKMHVHGRPDDCDNWSPDDTSLVNLVFQFGMDDDNFYEVVKPIVCQDTVLWKNKSSYIDIDLGKISRRKEGIIALDVFDPSLHDTGIDSVFSEFENGCGGALPTGFVFEDVLDSLGMNVDNILDTTWVTSDGDEVIVCGQLFWDQIYCESCEQSDPNGDNYSELNNPDGTENNGIYDEWEPFTDNNNNGLLDEAPENYDEETNIWEWSEGNGNTLEITHIRGEPSIDRINYIMIGVQNNNPDTVNTIKGTVLVNEMRFSGVRKTSGQAFRLKTDFNFADLLSVNTSFEKKDSEFRTLQERLGSGTTTEAISINTTLSPELVLPAQWGIRTPINVNYSSNVSTPKYRQGTDILVGSASEAPDSIKTISQTVTMSTSFKKTSRSDKWWLKYTLDKFSTNLSATIKESSNLTEKSNTTRNYDLTMKYDYQFSNENYWRPLKILEKLPLVGNTMAESKLFWSPKKIHSQMKLDEDNNIKLYRNGNENITEKLEMTRDYSVTYQLTNSLSSSYSKNIKSNLINFKNSTEKRLEALKSFNPGIVTNVSETLNNTFSPDNLRWLKPSITYNSSFSWVLNSLVDSLRNASISSTNTFKTSVNFNPKDFIELIYTPENTAGSSRPGTGRSRGRSSSRGSKSTGKKINIQNPIARAILKPFHSVARRVTPISFSYTISVTNSEGNVLADEMPGYSYRFGLSSIQNQLLNTNYFEGSGLGTHSQGVGSFSNNITHDLSLNSGLNFASGIVMKFTFVNKETIAKQNGGQETINKTLSLIPFGDRGKDPFPGIDKINMPFPNWDINWSGLQKLPFMNLLFNSVSLSHNYRGELSSTEQDGELKSENFTHQFSPLVGLNLRTKNKNSISINSRISQTLTINNNIQTGSTERNYTNTISSDLSYSRQSGMHIPIFFFRDFNFENDISFNLRMSYDTNVKSTITLTGESSVLQQNTSLSIKPEIAYSFTKWVNGGVHFDYIYTDNMSTGKRVEKDFGFSVKIKIQGK